VGQIVQTKALLVKWFSEKSGLFPCTDYVCYKPVFIVGQVI
jgi:hypothetical protein